MNDVGGIDVDIVGDGAMVFMIRTSTGIVRTAPYTCKNVYYPTNGVYHLRRYRRPCFFHGLVPIAETYSYEDFGLAQGDFDRQANQQKV